MRRQYNSSQLAQFLLHPATKEKDISALFETTIVENLSIQAHQEKPKEKKKKSKSSVVRVQASSDPESDQSSQKQALEKWMENLQHRLDSACLEDCQEPVLEASSMVAGLIALSSGDQQIPWAGDSFPSPDGETVSEEDSARAEDLHDGDGVKSRWGAAANLSDSTVEFLTESDYLSQLRRKSKSESLFTLQEQLHEKKVKEAENKPLATSRFKGGDSQKRKGNRKKKYNIADEKLDHDEKHFGVPSLWSTN